MIHYNLKCNNDHTFNSWFDSVDAFDKLEKTKMLSCPVCGSDEIKRAIMSPQVSSSKTKQAVSLSKPASEIEKKYQKQEKKLNQNQKMLAKTLPPKHVLCMKGILLYDQFMVKQKSKTLNL